MKKRILLAVSYDGTDYAGFQAQKSGVPTIEGELNRVLTELTGQPVEVIGASRTDAGVHAYCNLAVFDTESRIPPEKFAYAVNVRLPEQICVPLSMEVPEDFHPRRCSTVKTYEYRIYNAQMPDPMKRLYSYFSRYHFDVDAMREAAEYLVGEHDFKSFCSTYSSAKTTVREVLSVQVEEVPCSMSYQGYTASSQTGAAADGTADGTADGGKDWTEGRSGMPREIVIRVSGRGFLYNMVRIIAGTLMEVGRGFKSPWIFLRSCRPATAGRLAQQPPHADLPWSATRSWNRDMRWFSAASPDRCAVFIMSPLYRSNACRDNSL